MPVIYARLWRDEEDFYDSHHALKRGADKFTARSRRSSADRPNLQTVQISTPATK